MYYINEEEETKLLNELIHDDSTSCSSSLATTVSLTTDDIDELYLGAEANSFSCVPRKDLTRSLIESREKSRNVCNPLIALKHLYSSFDSDNSTKTYTSITTIKDLIRAREGDPCDFLAELGFVDNSERDHRRDVLSRFEPSSLLNDEDNKILETSQKSRDNRESSDYALEASRNKARDWLNRQLNDKENTNQLSSKNLQTNSDVTKKLVHGKAAKARIKYSKSRQSSFDLLPLLKEEDTLDEGEPRKESKSIADDKLSILRSKFPERFRPFTAEPSKTLCMNESANQEAKPQAVQLPLTNLTNEPVDGIVVDQLKNRSRHLQLHQPTRMESFELEEINSVNGETQNSKHQALTDLITSANNSNNNESPSFTSTCKLNQTQNYNDESETSSGFDDDDTMNTTSNLSTNHDLPVQVHSETDLHQVDHQLKSSLKKCKVYNASENRSTVLSGCNNNNNNNNNKSKHYHLHCSADSEASLCSGHHQCDSARQTSPNRASLAQVPSVQSFTSRDPPSRFVASHKEGFASCRVSSPQSIKIRTRSISRDNVERSDERQRDCASNSNLSDRFFPSAASKKRSNREEKENRKEEVLETSNSCLCAFCRLDEKHAINEERFAQTFLSASKSLEACPSNAMETSLPICTCSQRNSIAAACPCAFNKR